MTTTLPFEMLSAMRAALATAKIPACLELVEQYEEANEPVVVFSDHQAPIEALGARPGWAMLYGKTPMDQRQTIVDAFQAGKLKGVACSIKAAGVGITLTRADTIIFVDQSWVPALNEQAQDRICRIGQKRGCNIITLAADHPLDKRIAELLSIKQAMVSATVEKAQAPVVAKSAALKSLAETAKPVVAKTVRPLRVGPAVEKADGEFLGIVNALKKASQSLKYPKLQVQTKLGQKVVVQLCSAKSQYAGQVRVTDGGAYGVGRYFGQIDVKGNANNRLEDAGDDVLETLRELAKDPAAFAAAQGKELGVCCCCGAELENEISVKRGIGPICAQKWGF